MRAVSKPFTSVTATALSEILQFPKGKGDPKWQRSEGRLFWVSITRHSGQGHAEESELVSDALGFKSSESETTTPNRST